MSRDHWNCVYQGADPKQLGWYEPELTHSLRLIDRCELEKSDLIVDVGAGSSSLVSSLVRSGYSSLVAVDLSSSALAVASDQLIKDVGRVLAGRVRWVVDDLTSSLELARLTGVKLWHDRAVLHFLTSEKGRHSYLELLTDILAPGGYVVIGAFSKAGVKMCSGLPVVNYDTESLSQFLGNEFELLESFDHIHTTPGGEARPYVYTLFRHVP